MSTTHRIYEALGQDGYELCLPVRRRDFEAIVEQIDGTPRSKVWKPLPMELVTENMGRSLRPSDAPWLGSDALVFRSHAIDKLGSLLEEHGEVLPVDCDAAALFIFNPTRLVEATRTSLLSGESFRNRQSMMLRSYEFDPGVIAGLDIFKLRNTRASPTFLSQGFVDLWYASGLKGLQFQDVQTGAIV